MPDSENIVMEESVVPEQISIQIIMRLRQINQELSRHAKHIQDNFKMTVPQLVCLREVYEHAPISIGALSKIVFMNNSTVTRIVDILEMRNLIKRTRISNDRRKIHLEATDTGAEFIRNAPVPLQLRFFDRLKGLDEKQVSMILWSLEMLVDMLGDGISPMDIPTHLTLSQLGSDAPSPNEL
ncbi:MAG: MarR family transcriptional regulator [Proteobacteria bacterium]|nr:MarR family transcriptional regulator [Pseudomonadota bacterium]